MLPSPTAELDRLAECLRGLVDDHRKLVDLVRKHGAAMRALDASTMEALAQQQEQVRTRILQAEARRRMIVAPLVRSAKLAGEPTLTRLAAAFPTHRVALLRHRDDLRQLAGEVKQRSAVTGRIAQAMVGHLNTAVRMLAAAVERGGTYTKQGGPKLTRRLGSIEAVG
jgi:hypothetical protein